MTLSEELLAIATELTATAEWMQDAQIGGLIDRIESTCERIAKAWGGSWMGYHARVYYADFSPVPPGARFSKEWGLMDRQFRDGTVGEWMECDHDFVIETILAEAECPDLAVLASTWKEARESFEEAQGRIPSVLSHAEAEGCTDQFLKDVRTTVEKKSVTSASALIRRMQPTGQIITRDMVAVGQGMRVPPHIAVKTQAQAVRLACENCKELAKLAQRAGSHLSRQVRKAAQVSRIGTNIFIGHGRSKVWRDLKDFVGERLRLPYDEFNRVPVAGTTNVARLSEMLEGAAFAFLVLTAEDELSDGRVQARMNVIHEAGLFQGRLGFHRAIILLEEGCEQFSNVEGLGQIRFPKGNISAVFEEVRRVLEREELIAE